MNYISSQVGRALLGSLALVLGAGLVVRAQQPPVIKRSVVLTQDLSLPGREGIMVVIELPGGAKEERHSHHAESFVFMLEGSMALENEGNPVATLKAGDAVHIGQGKVHRATNVGSTPAKFVAVLIAEKGQPLTIPAK